VFGSQNNITKKGSNESEEVFGNLKEGRKEEREYFDRSSQGNNR
jgi:hypothetical protein